MKGWLLHPQNDDTMHGAAWPVDRPLCVPWKSMPTLLAALQRSSSREERNLFFRPHVSSPSPSHTICLIHIISDGSRPEGNCAPTGCVGWGWRIWGGGAKKKGGGRWNSGNLPYLVTNTYGLNFIKIGRVSIFSGGRSPLLGGLQ